MSDAQRVIRVDAPARAVMRDTNRIYYVFEYIAGYGWQRIENAKGYTHSTSAYAQLGRITNRENQAAIAQFGSI